MSEEPTGESTPLHTSCYLGQTSIAKLQIVWGRARVDARDPEGRTPLHKAAEGSHATVMDVLIKRRASVNARDVAGDTPLHIAARKGAARCAERLLAAAGINIDAANGTGATPLHLAAREGHLDVARVLLKSGANVQARDAEGASALDLAMEHNHLLMTELLLEHGFDPNAPDRGKGRTALHLAAIMGDAEVAGELIRLGAAVNVIDGENQTPLRVAADAGHSDVVAVLLEAGADINFPAGRDAQGHLDGFISGDELDRMVAEARDEVAPAESNVCL